MIVKRLLILLSIFCFASLIQGNQKHETRQSSLKRVVTAFNELSEQQVKGMLSISVGSLLASRSLSFIIARIMQHFDRSSAVRVTDKSNIVLALHMAIVSLIFMVTGTKLLYGKTNSHVQSNDDSVCDTATFQQSTLASATSQAQSSDSDDYYKSKGDNDRRTYDDAETYKVLFLEG